MYFGQMFEFVCANYFSAFLLKSPNEMVESFVENMTLYAGDWAARHHPFLKEETFIVLLCVAHLPETPIYAPLIHKYHDVLHSNYTYNLDVNFKTDLHYLELGGSQKEVEIVVVHIPKGEESDHTESEGSNISTTRSMSPEYHVSSPKYPITLYSSSSSPSEMSEEESEEPNYYYPGFIDRDDPDYDPEEDMDESYDN